MNVLWVVAMIALVAMLLLIALLAMPLKLWAHVQTTPRLRYQISASALGGLLPRMCMVDSARPRKPGNRKPATAQKTGKDKPQLAFARGTRIATALPGLLAEAIRAIHFDTFTVDAEFGLPDPADTGELYGWLTPLQYALPWPAHVDITLRPNFERACLDGEVLATVRLTMASLLRPAIRFAWRVFGPAR